MKSKIDFRMLVPNTKFENRFSKSDSKNRNTKFKCSESRIRKSIFYKNQSDIWDFKNSKTDLKNQNQYWEWWFTKIPKSKIDDRNPIWKKKNEIQNLNFGNPEFEKRFSKNELRNLRFPKFKNRFEKSESIIVELMAIYKKPWNQKNETCFKKV